MTAGDAIDAGGPSSQLQFADVYDELRRSARHALAGRELTLQPTALVHEAYVKFARLHPDANSRTHFLALAGRAMRQLLSNYVRDRRAQKRGGGQAAVTLSGLPGQDGKETDVEALSEVLERLAEVDERQSRIVELRFFAGMTMQEIADVMELSLSTVEAEWRHARSWLRVRLDEASS